MVKKMFRPSSRCNLINKFHRIGYIQQRKHRIRIRMNAPGFHRLPAHFPTYTIKLFPVLRYTIQMIEPENQYIQIPVLPEIAANILRLFQCGPTEPAGARRFFLPYILFKISLIKLFGRKEYKLPLIYHRICY